MPALREALSGAGFRDVRTYVQSGNVVLRADEPPDAVAEDVKGLVAKEFGLDIEVIVRTRDELAEVAGRDPLNDVVTNPKRYLVSFLSAEPEGAAVERIQAAAVGDERLVLIGRELYAWLPEGVGRSKLWAGLASGRLGVAATARNWATVTELLAISSAL
jgi:uncharacterized protein (DUF1697 family)